MLSLDRSVQATKWRAVHFCHGSVWKAHFLLWNIHWPVCLPFLAFNWERICVHQQMNFIKDSPISSLFHRLIGVENWIISTSKAKITFHAFSPLNCPFIWKKALWMNAPLQNAPLNRRLLFLLLNYKIRRN